MHKMAFLLLPAVFLTFVSGPALAQPRGGFGGPGGFGNFGADRSMLLMQKSIQEELKLDDKQLEQLKTRWDKQRKAMEKLRDMSPEEAEDAIAKQVKTNNAALTKLLKSDQSKRLMEISLQQRGTRALSDPEVTKVLGLNATQRKKIAAIQDESREEMGEVFAQMGGPGGAGFGRPGFGGPGGPGGPGGGRPGGPGFNRRGAGGPGGVGGAGGPGGGDPGSPSDNAAPPVGDAATPPAEGAAPAGNTEGRGRGPGGPRRPEETDEQREVREAAFKKIGEMRKGTDGKLLAVLTAKQQEKWQSMQGEPFKGEMMGPGFGGRPRGGRDGGERGDGERGDGEGGPPRGERERGKGRARGDDAK